MNHVLVAIAAGVLVALGRRVAGGVLNDWRDAIQHLPYDPNRKAVIGGVPACLIFATSVASAVLLGHGPWWGAVAAGLGAWLGDRIKGLWEAAGMGRLPPDNRRFSRARFCRDYAFLSLYGLQVAAVAIALTLCPRVEGTWWIVALGGASVAPIYALTWAIAERRPVGWWRGWQPPLAMGEWLWGTALGATVFWGMSS